jgi:ATP adenylyltransferase
MSPDDRSADHVDHVDDDGPGHGAVESDDHVEHVGEVARDARSDQPGIAVDDLQRLWAPWRFGYLAGDDPVVGCPFCVIPARDPADDATSLILHRGEHAFVIFNAYPYNPGHLMIVPYEHQANLEDLDVEVAGEIWELGRRTVAVLKQRVYAEGVNLGINLGRAGGAGIADHLHLHAVPRWLGDTNFISVVGASRVLPKALDELYEELAPGFA